MIRPTLNDQLCFALYRAQKKFNRLYNNLLRPFHLTYPQYLVLLVLWEKDGRSLKEIGQKLTLDSGTLTPMLKKMEKKGYILKKRSSIDERVVCIYLTTKAKEQKKPILTKVGHCLGYLSLEENDYFSLLQQLKDVTNNLGGIIDEKTL